jgi:hypothetical protein
MGDATGCIAAKRAQAAGMLRRQHTDPWQVISQSSHAVAATQWVGMAASKAARKCITAGAAGWPPHPAPAPLQAGPAQRLQRSFQMLLYTAFARLPLRG